MGQCCAKNTPVAEDSQEDPRQSPSPVNGAVRANVPSVKNTPPRSSSNNTWPSPFPHGSSPLPAGVSPSPARSTPRRFFRRPFPPPSPAKHIKASLAKRQGQPKPQEGPIPEDGGAAERPLDKTFGYGKNFGSKYELGKEVGRGHFGHTCSARARKGQIKGQLVAVKIISKAKVRGYLLCVV